MATPHVSQTPQPTWIVVQQGHDDLPRTPSDVVVLYRTTKPGASFGTGGLGTILGKQDKLMVVHGFARSVTVLTIHYGKADHFESMPPHVKQKFKSIQGIKRKLGVDQGTTKLFAVVLEYYKPKGPLTYELLSVRQRSGYGSATVHHVPPTAGTIREKQEFFRAPVATPGNTDASDTAGAAQSSGVPAEPSSSVPHVTSEQSEHTGTQSDLKRNDVDDTDVPTVAKETSVEDVGVETQHNAGDGIEPVHQHESHEGGMENDQKDVSMDVGSADQQTGDLNNVVEVEAFEQHTGADQTVQPTADSVDAADNHSSDETNIPQPGSPTEKPVAETTGPDDEDAKLPQVPVSVHAAQHKVNAANAPPPSALQPVDVKSTGTSDGHGMKEIMTELHRWPERFLNAYKNLPADYQDQSMNNLDIDEKFVCSDAGPPDDLLSIQRLCQRMELTSYSTSFSGIDSPGSAFAQLRYAASYITGTDVEHPQHLYGVEWDRQAQHELQVHPFPPKCLFGNIASFLVPGLGNELQHMKDTGTIDRLKEQVINKRALKTSMKAHCVAHGRLCTPEEGAMLHVAGTPCTADSPMGLQERQKSLPFCFFLVWAAMRIALGEPIVIQECVDQFDRSIFTEVLGAWDWTFVVLSPIQFGWPIARNRQWAVGRHRAKTLGFRSVFNIFSKLFFAPEVVGDWTMFWWQSEESEKDAGDLQEELTWAASRPESRWKTGVDSSSQREPPQLGDIMDDGSSVWEACLTTSEQKFYQTYMAKFPNSCYSLNQDPDVTPMYAPGQAMMTLIASINLMMSSRHRRWMTGLETFSSQGFPIDPVHSYGKCCNSYALRRVAEINGLSLDLPKSSRRATLHQAGNSMHVTISGMALLYVLTQVMMDPDVMAMQKFKLDRDRSLNAQHGHRKQPSFSVSPRKRRHEDAFPALPKSRS